MDTKSPDTAASVVPHSVLTAAAHELRGPLGVARGYLRLLERHVANDAHAKKAVEHAGRAADRLASLVDELSQYARLAGGEAHLHRTRTSVAALLTESVSRATLPATPVVHVRVEDTPGLAVDGDSNRLILACAALLTSLAHAQVDDATLVLSGRGSGPHASVKVITDYPAASAEEARPVRIDRSGAGLSLATAELTVRMHAGDLHEVWIGGTWVGYSLRLPLAAQPPGAAAEASSA